MFGFIPDMLLIIVAAALALGVGRILEARKARRSKPFNAADKFS